MDTVIIKIYGPRKFRFTKKSWFLPELKSRKYSELSETEKKSKRPYLQRFVFRPPTEHKVPVRVQVYEIVSIESKEVLYVLELEFSVPKLLYGNSLQEVGEGHREVVFDRLKSCLVEVGIFIGETEIIAEARVGAIHFCKNIPLPQEIQMQDILAKLALTDISKATDVTETEFKRGQVLHIYSGTVERVFYDKIADSMRPKVKRKDKGPISSERIIVDRYNLDKREVFRYEYRLKKTQTVMRDVNKALEREPKTYVAFKDVFTPGLCRKMILASWRVLLQKPGNQLALLGSAPDSNLLAYICSEAGKGKRNGHSLNTALISYGIIRAIQDYGVKQLRKTIFSTWSEDHSERVTKKIQAAAELNTRLPYLDSISFIDSHMEKSGLISLASLENGI